MLSHKKEKQELSNELTFHVLTVRYQLNFAINFRTVSSIIILLFVQNHKYSSRAAVSKAVDETLDRLTPHK